MTEPLASTHPEQNDVEMLTAEQYRDVLSGLVDWCESMRHDTEKLPENVLPAWIYNGFYGALLRARDAMRGLYNELEG